MVQEARFVLMLHLNIGNRRAVKRTPVHDAIAQVNIAASYSLSNVSRTASEYAVSNV